MNKKSIWEILEIKPTREKREIRKAYAAQAKKHHLEEDPNAFAELNQAYQQALCYADRSEEPEEKSGQNVTGDLESENRQNVAGDLESEEDRNAAGEAKASLLSRLEQAEKEAIGKSRKEGALYRLTALFEDQKRRKKQDCWREYFLSETFLSEQFDEGFGRGLAQYLEECNPTEERLGELPRPFILELAIAYALVPDTYGVMNTEGSFFNRVLAGKLWDFCTERWDIPDSFDEKPLNEKDFRVCDDQELIEKSRYRGAVRLLMKPENLVRLRSFSDYFALRSMNRQGYLTEKEREIWENILICGRSSHLYEKNGRNEVYPETRSVGVISLYAHWITAEDVPLCVCKYIYQEYDLVHLEHSSNQHLYQPLKLAILKRFPNIEADLYDSGKKEQMIRRWYQELMQIISDYHSCYDRREYEESEAIRLRVNTLFDRREWKLFGHDQDLFEKLYAQLARRKVMPPSLAEKFCVFYSEDYPWPDPQRVQKVQEGLMISRSFHRMLLETDYRVPHTYLRTEAVDSSADNRDFWEYFLTVGFGARSYSVVSSCQNQADYAVGNSLFLPAYMQTIYLPSMEWRKKFTGFDEEENRIISPKSTAFFLPDGRCFRVEFHLHHAEYFLENTPVIYPAFMFSELKQMMQDQVNLPEEFFFLLAVTSIEDGEREDAEKNILGQLKHLSLEPASLPILARMLAADNVRPAPPENEARRIQAVFYGEQERFCFKAEVLMRTIKIYRQTAFGWEELELLPGEGKAVKVLDLEGKKKFAVEKLWRLRQPKPVLLCSYSLEGLDNVAKMRQVIHALKEQEQHRKRGRRTHPYTPGWPWSPEEITPAIQQFFAEDGGWMLESYVVLQMGEGKRPCFERIFYSKMNIFGFDLFFQSPEFSESLKSRTLALEQKVKEKHLIVGHFGWGKSYEARKSFAPMPFAVGESKTFYAYDFLRLYKAKTLEELMAKLFDFSEVSRVDVYEGRLSVSRFDHELEYCYTEEDFQNYLDSKTKTLPDIFTKFGV